MTDSAPKLSVVVIAQNEEANLERCLESVRDLADEIVVLDGESRDRTRDIARTFTDRVFSAPFQGHIQQKNLALEKARGEWILGLDADECVGQHLASSLRKDFPKLRGSYDGFTLNRQSLFIGRWMCHSGWYPDRKLRLCRRDLARWGGQNPHDRLILPQGSRVAHLRGDLLHYTSPDLATHFRKQRVHSQVIAAEAYRAGSKVSAADFWFQPLAAFVRTFFLLQGFRDGRHGLVLASCAAFYRLQIAARLWELHLGEGAAQHPNPEPLDTVPCDT